MFKNSEAYSSFSVNDIEAAKKFYGKTLGLEVKVVSEEYNLLGLKIAGSRDIFIYPSPTHRPASFTILNFPVDDIDEAVDELVSRGVEFERYDGFDQDAKGIFRAQPIAWFTDPAGNVLSVTGR
ncbi:MAG: VOC family protein [Mycobacteriales bacterium]